LATGQIGGIVRVRRSSIWCQDIDLPTLTQTFHISWSEGLHRRDEMSSIQEEIDRNYEIFIKDLPNLLRDHRGQYALMKDGKIINYFSTAADARMAAEAIIKDGLFSIQQVTDAAIDLGYFNYAFPSNTIQS
jgi:hypothetical protein